MRSPEDADLDPFSAAAHLSVRVHVVMPGELVDAIDASLGVGGSRAEWIRAAVVTRLEADAFAQRAGFLAAQDHLPIVLPTPVGVERMVEAAAQHYAAAQPSAEPLPVLRCPYHPNAGVAESCHGTVCCLCDIPAVLG